MVAEADEDRLVVQPEAPRVRNGGVETLRNLVAACSIPAVVDAAREDASAVRPAPAENRLRESQQLRTRAPERERLHSGVRHDVGKPGGVAECVRLPDDARTDSKVRLEIVKADLELLAERPGGGKVRVGLYPRAAHHFPAPFANALPDATERFGIGFLQVRVEGRFAAQESKFGKLVHQVEDGAEGADSLVKPLAGVPQPYGVEVCVRENVESGHFVETPPQWLLRRRYGHAARR